jgi:hypothetical protein
MGGLQGIPFPQGQQPDGTSDLENRAAQAPQELGQALQNQQQSSQQPPPQQQQPPQQAQQSPQQQAQPQGQQPDPIEQLKSQLAQQATPQQGPQGGPVRRALQNFFSGMGQSMMHEAGLPTEYEKQQKALGNLTNLTSAQGLAALHQAVASQNSVVPFPLGDGTTVGVAQKDVAALVNRMMQSQSQQNVATTRAGALTTVQGMKGDTAETIQNLKNQALGTAQDNKLDMFKQSQAYNTWKTQFEGQNKLQIAQMSAGKAPAPMLQTAAFAQSGLNRLDDAQQAMQRLESRGVLGNVASNKLENWIFGNGLVDPTLPAQDKEDIGRLRAAASYTSSAAMRAHTGRTSREIYDDFKNTMGINQGPDAWKGAMGETRSMLNDYAQGATNAAVQKLRGGGQTQVTAPTSSGFAAWKANH